MPCPGFILHTIPSITIITGIISHFNTIHANSLANNALLTYVIAFSKHKNRTMYFDFGHKH